MPDRLPLRPPTPWRTIFLASAGIFLALALAAKFWGILPGEAEFYRWMVERASPGVTGAFWWLNHLGDKRVLAPAVLLLLWAIPRPRQRWWLWAGALVLAPIFEGLAKPLVGRLRPEGTAFGFPSGHVTAAAAFFSAAAYLAGKAWGRRPARVALWVTAAAFVLLVGIARVLLRAHWPSDVVGGAALGFACVALAAWWHERRG